MGAPCKLIKNPTICIYAPPPLGPEGLELFPGLSLGFSLVIESWTISVESPFRVKHTCSGGCIELSWGFDNISFFTFEGSRILPGTFLKL